mmetsp:Transcript_50052/g.104453  ORF Transcript_50052/g.104453 Transcript_50052/m.104453 type:complete len:91 (+) Transcript_50052:224-496(+)
MVSAVRISVAVTSNRCMESRFLGMSTSSKCRYLLQTLHFLLPVRKALIQVLVSLVLDLVDGTGAAVVAVQVFTGGMLEPLMSPMDRCGRT